MKASWALLILLGSAVPSAAQLGRAPIGTPNAGGSVGRGVAGAAGLPSESWPTVFEGLSLGVSLKNPLQLAPMVRILINSGVTEETFRSAPVEHRQAWATQARRLAQAEAESAAVAVLSNIASTDLATAKKAGVAELHRELAALQAEYGPYLAAPVASVVDTLARRLAPGIGEGDRERLIRSIRSTIAALGVKLEAPYDGSDGVSLRRAKDAEFRNADPLVPGLPATPILVGGAAAESDGRFFIQSRQMALVDLTGHEGGHHVRLARLGGDQIAVIYGTKEFTRLSPGQAVEIGRAPAAAKGRAALRTEQDSRVQDTHATVRYDGGGNLSVTDHSGAGVSIVGAIGGVNVIHGRYDWILGRVFAAYNALDSYGEIVRLEMSGRLKSLYEEVRSKGDEKTGELDWVNLVIAHVAREIPTYNMAHVLALSQTYRITAGDFAESALGGVGGVCRQFGLAIAALLEQLTVDGVIGGRAYYATGALEGGTSGHAWAEYEAADGQVYALDQANKIFGPSNQLKFPTGDLDAAGKDDWRPFSAVAFPAENR